MRLKLATALAALGGVVLMAAGQANALPVSSGSAAAVDRAADASKSVTKVHKRRRYHRRYRGYRLRRHRPRFYGYGYYPRYYRRRAYYGRPYYYPYRYRRRPRIYIGIGF